MWPELGVRLHDSRARPLRSVACIGQADSGAFVGNGSDSLRAKSEGSLRTYRVHMALPLHASSDAISGAWCKENTSECTSLKFIPNFRDSSYRRESTTLCQEPTCLRPSLTGLSISTMAMKSQQVVAVLVALVVLCVSMAAQVSALTPAPAPYMREYEPAYAPSFAPAWAPSNSPDSSPTSLPVGAPSSGPSPSGGPSPAYAPGSLSGND